jgi:hypothetical protein
MKKTSNIAKTSTVLKSEIIKKLTGNPANMTNALPVLALESKKMVHPVSIISTVIVLNVQQNFN